MAAAESVDDLLTTDLRQAQADGNGGYVLRGRKNVAVFQLSAPTVHDAAGHTAAATLIVDRNPADIQLDSAFPASATYPVTIDRTIGLAAQSASASDPSQPAADEAPAAIDIIHTSAAPGDSGQTRAASAVPADDDSRQDEAGPHSSRGPARRPTRFAVRPLDVGRQHLRRARRQHRR